MSPTAAIAGTGAMGSGIARRLLESGWAVHVWNRTSGRAGPLEEVGAEIADNPAALAAAAPLVLTVLSDDDALLDTLTRPQGLAEGLGTGDLVLNLGTVAPRTVQRAADAAAGAGAALIDVGMLGNSRHAATGELRLYVGGDSDHIAQAQPLLDTIAKEVRQVGPLGNGMCIKVLLNLLMGLEMQALAEIVALGTGMGIDRTELLSIVTNSGFSAPVMGFKAHRMIARDYGAPDFRLRLMAKDLELAVAQARSHALDLRMTEAAWTQHVDAVAAGAGDSDCAAIVEQVCDE